jgi:1-deoxy-D-xylulose-5-phosphate reductoisomerase
MPSALFTPLNESNSAVELIQHYLADQMSQEKKKIAILGSTGSIGTQALDVIRMHSDKFEAEVLTAQSNAELLIKQAKEFKPNCVVIGDKEKHGMVRDALWSDDIKVYAGSEALAQVTESETVDLVLTALVGFAGLKPTATAIQAGKPIALANKETLVVAGELITQLAQKHAVNILPVDSEHSAIFQCLAGEWNNKIEKIYLTASGGPFRGKSAEELKTVTKAQALKHPNWDMGAKITIDSASLMNKGLEVIEAKWLFHLRPEQIDVIVHPQSIIHSIVQFEDGSMKAQMGLPDMKLPIQYAMAYPMRISSNFPRFNFMQYPQLTFEQPDRQTFRCLDLAFRAMHEGHAMPCVLNAANEIAVKLFLEEKIGFLEIAQLIESVMDESEKARPVDIESYIAIDSDTRKRALAYVN